MEFKYHQQAIRPTNRPRPLLPQVKQLHDSPSSKPSYDHMQAWQHLPIETQDALPKGYWRLAPTKSVNIQSASTNESHTDEHTGVFSSLICAIDAELNNWQTTTTSGLNTNSGPFNQSFRKLNEESPHDSAIDLNDFAWTSTPKSASVQDGPKKALRMLEGRDGEYSPTVPPLFFNATRAVACNDDDGDNSFHVTRSNVYRAAGLGRESDETSSFRQRDVGFDAEVTKEEKVMSTSTGNETTCVGNTKKRVVAEDRNAGSVRRVIRKLRRVSKFGGL